MRTPAALTVLLAGTFLLAGCAGEPASTTEATPESDVVSPTSPPSETPSQGSEPTAEPTTVPTTEAAEQSAPTSDPTAETAEAATDEYSDGHSEEHPEGEELTEHYDGPNVTWSDEDEAKVRDTAQTVMQLFARPDVPETQWFSELEPMLAVEYAEDAKYIDPARVPITTITDGPAISREAGNPMTVTASFYTNDGPWDILLHRIGQDAPWLVTSISPKTS